MGSTEIRRGGQEVRTMADVLDFREEARGCLHSAEAETHPEVRTVLMGMVLGWLTFANQMKSRAALQHEPADGA